MAFDVVGRLVALVVVAAVCLLFGSFCCISFCVHRLRLQIEGLRLQKILFRIKANEVQNARNVYTYQDLLSCCHSWDMLH